MEAELAFRGNCRGCGRAMIGQRDYLDLTPEQRAGRVYIMGYGMCSTCHGRALRAGTLPFPAPPPQPRPRVQRFPTWVAYRSAKRDMRAVGFAQMPKVCKHDNGVMERRVIRHDPRGHNNRTVKKECRECGLHLGYDEPDNPALPSRQELAAYQHPPPPVQPWTWGVMQYRRLNKWTVVAVAPRQCPWGHVLDDTLLTIGPWSDKHRSRTYTCRACHDVDPYIATWRPRAAKPRQAQPKHTSRLRMHAVVWRDGSLHVIADTWSDMALDYRQRHGA